MGRDMELYSRFTQLIVFSSFSLLFYFSTARSGFGDSYRAKKLRMCKIVHTSGAVPNGERGQTYTVSEGFLEVRRVCMSSWASVEAASKGG